MSAKYPRLDATRNYVIDLETLALGPDAIVTSAALAQFDATSTRLIATWTVDTKAQQRDGRVMDADTVLWWMRQSEGARMSVAGEEAQRAAVHPRVFLLELIDLLIPQQDSTGPRDTNVALWAKPQHFDIAVLEHMCRQYKVHNYEAALHRRKVHNVRTALAMVNLLRLGEEDLDEARADVAHDAAADAMVTAAVMRDALAEIAGVRALQAETHEEAARLAQVVDDYLPMNGTRRALPIEDVLPGSVVSLPFEGDTLAVRLVDGTGWYTGGTGADAALSRTGWRWWGSGGTANILTEGLTEEEAFRLSGCADEQVIEWCKQHAATKGGAQ